MRNRSTEVIYELIKKDKNVIAVTGDLGNEIYVKIAEEYPKQFIDYGVSESNMIGSCAGLARCGKIPFIYTITNFIIMRGYEFVRNDICNMNANVKFIGRSAGLSSSYLGMTHQGTEDISLLRSLPNMIVINPATPIEAREAMYAVYEYNGPCYVRLEGAGEAELFDNNYDFILGKGKIITEGSDIAVIATGSIIIEAIEAAKKLREEGISVKIINISTIVPLDKEIIKETALQTKAILTLEEHNINGGLGSAVAEVIAENGIGTVFKRMGLNGFSKGYGNRKEALYLNKISREFIIQEIREMMSKL